MLTESVIWWYGEGISVAWRVASAILFEISDFFSLPTLLKTLFAPWKNDVITAHNISLGDQFKIWELNFVSRLVGFFVRSVIILVTLIILAMGVILEAVLLVFWLIIPLMVYTLPLIGIWVLVQ